MLVYVQYQNRIYRGIDGLCCPFYPWRCIEDSFSSNISISAKTYPEKSSEIGIRASFFSSISASEIFSEGTVWKACRDFKVLSEDTGHGQKVSCNQMKGQPAAVFGKELAVERYFTEGEKNVFTLFEVLQDPLLLKH